MSAVARQPEGGAPPSLGEEVALRDRRVVR